jgi:hypothetical protein
MKTVALILSICIVLIPTLASAATTPNENVAKSLADLLVAGRAVISQNQDLINDAAKADKGFTSSVFEEKVVAEYRGKTGIDLSTLKASDKKAKLLLALLAAQKEAVNDFQPIINRPGMAFKGFTPAVFGFRTAERFIVKTGISIKQTSVKYRNAANRPDAFETHILGKFETPQWSKGQGYSETSVVAGKPALRYMQPLYIADSCLKCHGDPKGSLDVSGRAREGYKVGELRGAISVIVPAE